MQGVEAKRDILIMGIDPGLKGGLCIVDQTGKLIYQRPMPLRKNTDGKPRHYVDVAIISAILAKYEPTHVFIEKVHAMPGQGVSSTFTFGLGYGMILGLLMALDGMMETTLVTPQTWHKRMTSDVPLAGEAKRRAAYKYDAIHPSSGITHDGIIDATLIAEYGRLSLQFN